MNIFFLDRDVTTCAQYHVDKHVVKMILEYAQLLSTAHRVLDGHETTGLSPSGRKQKVWKLDDERDSVLYKATHINHPSAKWARHSLANYQWLFRLFQECLTEYTYRYGKTHSCARLVDTLRFPPTNIPIGEFCDPWRAMPDDVKIDNDSLASYRNYYIQKKASFARWSKRSVPEWFTT